MQPALALRFGGLDLVRLRQRRQQRLRLGDLRHFWRRRKAFERGREHGVGFGGAVGRLIELGKRQRRAQSEAARALLLRDRDGGQEGFLRGRGVRGVALEQDFAARPMLFGLEGAVPHAIVCRQRFIKDCDAAARIARASLGLGQRNLEQSIKHQNVLFARKIDAATHVLEPGVERAALPLSPSLRETLRKPET